MVSGANVSGSTGSPRPAEDTSPSSRQKKRPISHLLPPLVLVVLSFIWYNSYGPFEIHKGPDGPTSGPQNPDFLYFLAFFSLWVATAWLIVGLYLIIFKPDTYRARFTREGIKAARAERKAAEARNRQRAKERERQQEIERESAQAREAAAVRKAQEDRANLNEWSTRL